MTVIMIQSKLKAESVADVQAAITKMLIALDAAQLEGVRYASLLLPDGQTLVALLQVDDGKRKSAHRSAGVPGAPGNRRAGAG